MIARILYRENVHGVLNYVLGKTKSAVLGFQNTYSDMDTDKEFFGSVLYHLGNRHGSEKRYVHTTINLPRGERLGNGDFFELSKEYMEHMGYGEQPFMVVRHYDTKHEHVHIVSTTIREDGSMIDLSNDFRRNVATQKHLEKRYGLSPSPEAKQQNELPIYWNPQFKNKDVNGVRFYMQDILNNTLQKYKVRSFRELTELVRPHHIQVKTVKNNKGRVGVTYGIAINDCYRSRFIDGHTVHPKLSGPKLQKVFEKNLGSKLLPMVRKRLEKQLRTTYKLFRTIDPKHLPDILKSHQKMDCKVDYDKEGTAIGFRIYDKSGYTFKGEEISRSLGIRRNTELFGSGYTQMYMESGQLTLELRKAITEGFRISYNNSGRKNLFSEHINGSSVRKIAQAMAKSERIVFLKKYLHTDNRSLGGLIQAEFPKVKDDLHIKESVREENELEKKAALVRGLIDKHVFDAPKSKGILFELLRSLGAKYDNGTLTYANSYRHRAELNLGNVPWPKQIDFHVSPGFVRENEKVLAGLLQKKTEKEIGPSPTAIFLPLMFPNVYQAMAEEYRIRFETLGLKAYMKNTEHLHRRFEKSPEDYIRFFNAKGFYFKKLEGKMCICSIYSKYPVSVALAPKLQAYLFSSNDLYNVLENQPNVLQSIKNKGQNHLKNLWSSYLIERGQYKKAAYLLELEGARPNLPSEILEFHMENGLRETLLSVSNKQVSAKQARLLRRGVYAIGNLLGSRNPKREDAFNGFRDELTDYSKYKRNGLSM